MKKRVQKFNELLCYYCNAGHLGNEHYSVDKYLSLLYIFIAGVHPCTFTHVNKDKWSFIHSYHFVVPMKHFFEIINKWEYQRCHNNSPFPMGLIIHSLFSNNTICYMQIVLLMWKKSKMFTTMQRTKCWCRCRIISTTDWSSQSRNIDQKSIDFWW